MSRPARTPVLAVLTAVALLLAGCSAGGDDDGFDTTATAPLDSTTTTTTIEVIEDPTTTGGGPVETTTTTGDGGGDPEVSRNELEALLPEPADVGPEYEIDPDEGDDGGTASADQAVGDACPELLGFLEAVEDNDDEVGRRFVTADQRGVEVRLTNAPRNMGSDAEVEAVVAAANQCRQITYSQDGFDVAMEVSAARNDTFGDRGAVISVQMTMEHPHIEEPFTIFLEQHSFVVDSVGVRLGVTSGLVENGNAIDTVDGDFDLLGPMGAEMETRVQDVVG